MARVFGSFQKNIRKLISFEGIQIFNASTYSSLVWFDKAKTNNFRYNQLNRNLIGNDELKNYLKNLIDEDFTLYKNTELTDEKWILTEGSIQ